ncbi:magnesium-protoporphyrin IX monomethyl ester (oxidative) cyclase [Congregibacter sp.]|uniref:magnesium-protoporphyrin IX monomethyl ester (oxidative) cyclase n=1 Tax=Congregibacter sp. TaxID=2744308 RepID=UPI003F6C626A
MNAPMQTARINDTTEQAVRSELLAPRFYRTDYDAVGKINVEPVQKQWDAMMEEYKEDRNRAHFRQEFDYDATTLTSDPELHEEFIDFLTSSITAEYSGCVLYQEIKKNVDNEAIADLMGYMARDESRHAGFINKALKQLGVAVDLGFLKRQKEYTFFRPKFIYYATYLSEKIGYARYITIYRHLEKHPEQRFHPIFNWFMEWCNDEFRHGESFALLMRAQPELLRGHNKLWIRFFILAVYSTMYVRDHNRPKLYEALGMDPTEFDFRVFDITTAITQQVFPLSLNTNDPRFRKGLERLRDISARSTAAKERGGIIGQLKVAGLAISAGLTFARLYCLPAEHHELPADFRMEPTW